MVTSQVFKRDCMENRLKYETGLHIENIMKSDIIVIGAGHAGCEAAYAAARLGKEVLLISLSRQHIGRLSCNPAIGGLAKGNLVREIDALGGIMAKIADQSAIHFRRLNTRKGLAVQASRAQVDIDVYPKQMQAAILEHPNITFIEGEAAEIEVKDGVLNAIILADETRIETKSVILTTGTFLSGTLHCGETSVEGGRVGESAAYRLSACLQKLGLRLGRLKTGTTPRLDANTIDWDRTEKQEDIVPNGSFSFSPQNNSLPQVDCYITHTNSHTHEIIRTGLHRSPLFSGKIVGRGPRYCPSIEDKVVRFEERERHLLFLEPEGNDTNKVYINGLSTSLPKDLQEDLVHSIVGLENAKILQYGYAVEYDYANPLDLHHSLEHKLIPGLYLAGQINGTSGYEEAAAQGLIAGLSAAMNTPFILRRDQAYIGVLIDDLVTKGVGGEPYRMFSSRAEHRLLLREDNADRRLCPIARNAKLLTHEEIQRFELKQKQIEIGLKWCQSTWVRPDKDIQARFKSQGLPPPKKKFTVEELLRRPEVNWNMLYELINVFPPKISETAVEQVETDIKYAGYLARETRRAEQTKKLSSIKIPTPMNYMLPGISNEVAERLTEAQPLNLATAARLPGVTPAAIDILAIHLAKTRGHASH